MMQGHCCWRGADHLLRGHEFTDKCQTRNILNHKTFSLYLFKMPKVVENLHFSSAHVIVNVMYSESCPHQPPPRHLSSFLTPLPSISLDTCPRCLTALQIDNR